MKLFIFYVTLTDIKYVLDVKLFYEETILRILASDASFLCSSSFDICSGPTFHSCHTSALSFPLKIHIYSHSPHTFISFSFWNPTKKALRTDQVKTIFNKLRRSWIDFFAIVLFCYWPFLGQANSPRYSLDKKKHLIKKR